MKEQFINIDVHGTKHYYSDREMNIHHRKDGPAIEYADGGKVWYLNDEHLTEEEFNTRMKPPTHFRPTNDNISACGIVHPQYAAYDGRDVNCLSCRKTKAWKTYMGQNAKRIR